MTELYNTESPIDRKRRNNINATWDDILSRFANLQRQINILAGGQEVDELIARLEQAIKAAEIDVQNYIIQVDKSVQQAINENNNALQTALQTVSEMLDELNIAIGNAETATADTINAKNATIQATKDAQEAINTMQSLIDNFGSRGTWSTTTQYFKNNLVEVDGRTYIALKENINTPVTNEGVWALFADKGIQGAEGPRGLPGKDGKDGTGVNILGSLNNESELPTTGKPGEAYMIAGDLYVWQDNTNAWKNVGPIRGPQGKSAYDLAVENGFEGTMEEWIESLKGETGPRGPEGPQGPPGQDADLTEVTEQLAEIAPKANNSWQKGIYNDTDITNLGNYTAEKTLYISNTDWNATGNVEQLDIIIPVGGSFSGLIKVTYTTFWGDSDSHGGATVLYRIGNYTNGGTKLNDYIIETITPDFAKDYYIHQPFMNTEDGNGTIILLLSKAPSANNPLIAKIEFQGYNFGQKNAFRIMNETNFVIYDNGSPTHNGYPWTPQVSRIPTNAQMESWNKRSHYIGINRDDSDPDTEMSQFFICAHPKMGGGYWYVENKWYLFEGFTSQMQIATSYHNKSDFKVRYKYADVWGEWSPSLQDLKQSVSNGKAQVASAITGKGVQTASDATFSQMANNIRAIPTLKSAKGTFNVPALSPYGKIAVTIGTFSFNPKNISSNLAGAQIANGMDAQTPNQTGLKGDYYQITNNNNGTWTVVLNVWNMDLNNASSARTFYFCVTE